MSVPPLCKDCKYAKRDWTSTGLWLFGNWWKIIWPPWFRRGFDYLWRYAYCRHPAAIITPEVNPVSGIVENKEGGYHSCSSMRMSLNDSCGKEGRLFEPKES